MLKNVAVVVVVLHFIINASIVLFYCIWKNCFFYKKFMCTSNNNEYLNKFHKQLGWSYVHAHSRTSSSF